MAENSNGNLHIAMLPWLAFGHIIPFLELAKLIAIKGHKISFLSTPRNIDRLPQIPQTLNSCINFVKIDLPKVENLPENAEATKDIPLDTVKYLKIACDRLQQPIADFIKASSPDWIICDFHTHWLGPLAAKHGVRMAYFIVFPPVFLGFFGSPDVLMYGCDGRRTPEEFIKRPKWVSFESEVGPSLFHLTRTRKNVRDGEEHVRDTYRLGVTINACDAVVVRNSLDYEPDWLNLLRELYQKPVIPAGLLPATASEDDNVSWQDTRSEDDNVSWQDTRSEDDNASWQDTREWLDKHEKGSIVYIAFGTETKPSQYELTQLALGLEMCGLPFYWVLIDQRGSSDDEVIELPHGFEERTCERGIVCRSWAPQFKILSHDSVGGLLIHSGMSSAVEGLQLGKPLVLLPLLMDQGLIASYLVEKIMAYKVHRNNLDGSFEPKSVADSLCLVMVKEEGNVYREKACWKILIH